MPVEDHEVHERVKISADKPYSCNSRERFSKSYFAPDRVYRPNGTFYIIQREIEHAMSDRCRNFYLWDADPRCAKCTAPKDEDYANTMRGLE